MAIYFYEIFYSTNLYIYIYLILIKYQTRHQETYVK